MGDSRVGCLYELFIPFCGKLPPDGKCRYLPLVTSSLALDTAFSIDSLEEDGTSEAVEVILAGRASINAAESISALEDSSIRRSSPCRLGSSRISVALLECRVSAAL